MNKFKAVAKVVEVQAENIMCIVPAWCSKRQVPISKDRLPESIYTSLSAGDKMLVMADISVEDAHSVDCDYLQMMNTTDSYYV